MAILAYPYSVRDSANTSTDNRKTGLTPTVSNGKTLAAFPATVLASTVTIVEIGAGDYIALYNAESNLDASFPIDWGASLTSPNDRYGTLILTRDAGRIITNLDVAVSTLSTYAGTDTSGTMTLLTRIGGNLTIAGGKVAATLAATDVTGNVPANVTQFLGHAAVVDANNYPSVNVVDVAGSVASAGSGAIDANVVQVAGQTANAAAAVTFPASIGTSTYAGGAVASVAGAVGSVTGNVGGNVLGNVAGSVNSLTNLPSIPANWITAAGIATAALNGKGDWSTTTPPTSAVIAAAVWDLATSGHTTSLTFGAAMNAAGSAGDPWATALPGSYGAGTAGNIVGVRLDVAVSTRSTYAGGAVASVTGNVGGNVLGSVAGSVASVTGSVNNVSSGVTVATNNDKTGYSLTTAPPTAAAIATAVWQDTTAGDFATASSPGKILVTQLGGAFTTTSSSVYSTASLANAPTGGSAPTAAAIATAVWTDTTGSDFTTASSPGKALLTGGVPVLLSQTGLSPRALDSVADASLTLGDALVAALCAAAGKESVSGTSYVRKTPFTGTTIRTFTLDSGTAPASRA